MSGNCKPDDKRAIGTSKNQTQTTSGFCHKYQCPQEYIYSEDFMRKLIILSAACGIGITGTTGMQGSSSSIWTTQT